MQTVLDRLGLPLIPDPPPIADTFARFKDWAAPFVLSGSAVNDLGYPSHLAGVGVLIMRSLPLKGDEKVVIDLAASMLKKRQPKNPFFALLAGSPAEEIAKLVTEVCPRTAADVPKDKVEWIWERKDGSDAPQRTMLWDCIFMANMLERLN
jgi:hypothetical protein